MLRQCAADDPAATLGEEFLEGPRDDLGPGFDVAEDPQADRLQHAGYELAAQVLFLLRHVGPVAAEAFEQEGVRVGMPGGPEGTFESGQDEAFDHPLQDVVAGDPETPRGSSGRV